MNEKIKVHYTGSLIDRTVFDSSYEDNVPAEFIVGQVIPGWVEALQLMPVGSRWRVFIPEDLAYGVQPPRGSSIKPFATLIFEVELLDILPASAN
jgi:FKBP-type peptidyl-prolyl cis-trans isomerase FklB